METQSGCSAMEPGTATTSLTPADEAKLYAARNLSSRQIMSDNDKWSRYHNFGLFLARMFTVQSRNLQDKVTDNPHKKVTFIISTTSRMEAFFTIFNLI